MTEKLTIALILLALPQFFAALVFWAFILSLFYGYVIVRTRSLPPPMIFHYLGKGFIGSLTGHMQSRASIEMQALYGVIFSLGIVPTTLMILWTRFFSSRWLPSKEIGNHAQNNSVM